MKNLQKIEYNGEEITIEKVEADEIRRIAKENNGSFNDTFGIYFVLTNKKNNLPLTELIKSQDYTNYMGHGGTINNTLEDFDTHKKIFSGAELCDLAIMPVHRRKGYASLITRLRLNWLKEQGYNEAFFPYDNKSDSSKAVIKLFQKLQEEKILKFEKIGKANYNANQVSVYRIHDF
jgi:hypothetical protein